MLLALIGGAGAGTTTTTNYALLLALTSDVATVTPPTGTTNYALLLALTSEAGTPAPVPTPPRGLGLPSGRRIKRSELDRRLKEQRDNTFGRRWFDEFQAAERAAREAALQAPKKAARKALDRAADAAAQVVDELNATDAQVDLRPLTAALEALSGAKKLSETIAASKGAIAWAHKILADMKEAEDADEDDAMILLMLS